MDAHGTFVWNELVTRDVEAAKRFYSASLGWGFEGMPMPDGGTYWVASRAGKAVAGIMDMNAPEYREMQPHWFAYVAVDQVDDRVSFAEREGGRLVRPIFEVKEVGRIAIVQDPTGAVLGWMTPARPGT